MEEFRRIKRELVAKGAIIDYYQDTCLLCRFPTVTLQNGI